MSAAWERTLARRITRCDACTRLAAWCATFRGNAGYWARPVPGFGDPEARILVLGLAPGAHGANRTGRPFTGDGAGVFLFRALHEHGFSSCPESVSRDDSLELRDIWITNIVKCVPPANKPKAQEVARCLDFLRRELERLSNLVLIVALGRLAHDAILRLARESHPDLRLKDHPFAHGRIHRLPQPLIPVIDSFHTSRYNVNTRRLTYPMFSEVFTKAHELLPGNKKTAPIDRRRG